MLYRSAAEGKSQHSRTSLVQGNNLHRVVMYRDGADRARLVEPYTMTPPLGSPNPVDLWKWMAEYEKKTAGQVLAIAHNGNLSNGIMFPEIKAFGKKIPPVQVLLSL